MADEPKTAEEKAKDEEIEISKRLSAIEAKTESDTKTLAGILADPDVRKVIEAKTRGEKVAVQGESEIIKPLNLGEDEVDLDTLTNKELTKTLTKRFTRAVDEAVTSRLKPIVDQLGIIGGRFQDTEVASVQKEVEQARKEHADFDSFKEGMLEISREAPKLNVSELYLLAKRRKVGLNQPSGKVETERPSSTTTRPPKKNARETPLPAGRRGYEQLVKEALNDLDLGDTV